MRKKRRSAAQVAATRRMLAANRRHKNPSPARRRKATRRRTVHRAAPVSYRRRRVHRNPSVGSKGGMLGELMSKDGLMMIAAVAATPTLMELAAAYVLPKTLTGTTRIAAKTALGLGLGWAVHKYVSKKAGMVVALVSVGWAAASVVEAYMSPTGLTGGGGSGIAAPKVVGSYIRSGANSMGGYQSLGGYSDPGTVRM